MAPTLLERHLPSWQFEERHGRHVAASPLDDDPVCRALLGLRELPALLAGRRAAQPGFSATDFTLLGRTEDEIAWGLAGCFWRPGGGLLRSADAAAFDAPLSPGCARLVWSFEATPDRRGTRLHTTTRVHCRDRAAFAAFAPYWTVIRPFSGLVRCRLLGAIARRAEARGERPTRP